MIRYCGRMQKIPSSKATPIIGSLFERAAKGEHILITRYGRPYVLISPPPDDMPSEEDTTETT